MNQKECKTLAGQVKQCDDDNKQQNVTIEINYLYMEMTVEVSG